MKDNEIIETWQKIQDILKRTENVVLQKDAIDDLVRHITNILDLINRQKADYDRLRKAYFRNQEIFAEQSLENERLKAEIERLEIHTKMHDEIKSEAYKEFAEKVDEILKRYAHLHKNADKARHSTEEYADGTPMEMVSVWEVLSLKKWEMCDYETMNTLEDNIETIAKERLLTELEKDLRLLKQEMVGEDNAKDND